MITPIFTGAPEQGSPVSPFDSLKDLFGNSNPLINSERRKEAGDLELFYSGAPDLEKDRTKQFYIHQSLAPVHQAYFTDE